MASTHLFELADQLYLQAPWQWMSEDQVIGLRHPETGELAYISIMGEIGNHRCLALYLGQEALRRFNLLQCEDPFDPAFPEDDSIGLILETRQLQLVFESRAQLARHEHVAIKKAGRKYRGDNWPAFRSFRPGYAPGPLNAEETLWLTLAIEQLMIVAPSLKDDACAYFRLDEQSGESDSLTRACIAGVWQTTWTPFDGYAFEFPTPDGDPALIAKIATLEQLTDVECAFKLVPSPVGSDPSAMLFPYFVISAEVATGRILGVELLSVEKQSYAELIASIPNIFMRQWDRLGIRPASIRVATITSYSMLETIAAALNTPMRRHDRLPAIDRFLENLPL